MIRRKKVVYKSAIPTEDQEQIALVKWLNNKQIPFYHIPNGGTRNLREGRKFKLLGVQAGIPDICIPVGRNGYYSLYIEMKRSKGGIISDSQKYWHIKLRELNCAVFVANGCIEAIKIISEYFK